MNAPHPGQELVEWGVAGRPIDGEAVSGDLHVFQPTASGVLLAAIDGVGHGDEATLAARAAAEILVTHASEPIPALVRRCHEALTETRGVVMTIASIDGANDTMTWLGVGNVDGRLLRPSSNAAHVLLRAGLVGYQLPNLDESIVPLTAGDTLILSTDGIRGDYPDDLNQKTSPGDLAARILDQYFKGIDDALVLVARYNGVTK